MGVLTSFYRVPTGLYDRILADLDVLDAIELGETDAPPSVNIGKIWEETRLLLAAAGHAAIASVFADAEELSTENGVDVQALPADVVQKLAPMLASVALDGVAKAAIESEDYDGFRAKPWEAESAAKALAVVVDFVREAAAAREAILITTS